MSEADPPIVSGKLFSKYILLEEFYALVGREVGILSESQDGGRPQGDFVHELNPVENWSPELVIHTLRQTRA